jgi:hypothetical protein
MKQHDPSNMIREPFEALRPLLKRAETEGGVAQSLPRRVVHT